MSAEYTTVQWNRNKKVYDVLLMLGIAASIILNILVSASQAPQETAPSTPIIILRALGDTGFILLNLILVVGPLARLDSRFLPLLYNRRHMGVIFFLIVLLHGAFALMWYHGFGVVGPLTSLFMNEGQAAAISNYPFQPLGFFALLIFFVMAATSHDYWNTVLGPGLWKALHMAVYLAYGLVLMHLVLGALQSENSGLSDLSPWLSLLWVGGLHLASIMFGGDKTVRLETAEWVEVPNPEKIEPGAGKVIQIGGNERVAVFRTEADEYGAISNVCRHQAGPLGEGCMKDGLVTCPWHGFQYQLEDGQSPPPFKEKIETYEMEVLEGRLYIKPNPLPAGTKRPLVQLKARDGEKP